MMDEALQQRLRQAGQARLVPWCAQLDEPDRQRLEDQLAAVDLELLRQLTAAPDTFQEDWADLARRSEPPAAFCPGDDAAQFSVEAAREAGRAALRAGQVAVIIVAGGQGTRLGYPHPKGMFPIGPVSNGSLFQVLFERVRATARRYGAPVPLMVMTSPATHDDTVAFLERHDRFGLPADDVDIFCQGTMPAVDARSGQLLLAARDSLALSPDGHGGMLAALERSGCLEKARRRGIECFSYGQVDNPLVQIGNPELIGYHLLSQSEMTSQVIRKRDPWERVGNVVVVDGRTRIIEYSDLPDDVATARNPDGSLVVWAGSIAVHVFQRTFLERVAGQAEALPFHRALKKVVCLDAQGAEQTPAEPNAIKFERFIFDLLPAARHPIVVEGDPAEVFAPVKNAEGAATDTPTTARQAMVCQHGRWLRAAGVEVAADVPVEISPLWALDAEQVAERIAGPLQINQPTYFQET